MATASATGMTQCQLDSQKTIVPDTQQNAQNVCAPEDVIGHQATSKHNAPQLAPSGYPTDIESGPRNVDEFVTELMPTQSRTRKRDVEKLDGDILVEWDGIDDRERAMNWPGWYRSYITVLVGLLTITSTFASSAPSQLLANISERYHVSEEVSKVAVFVFLAGYIFGPTFWAPLSEIYGVYPLFVLNGLGAAVFNIACAHSPNIGGLIIFRILSGMFGSCPLALGAGVIAFIWRQERVGIGMSFFASAPMAGPAMGPLIGGWIAQSGTTYQWIFWALGIFSGAVAILTAFTMKESNPDVTLAKKARRLRQYTGNPRFKAPIEVRKINLKEIATQRLLTPLLMLFLEPMLLAVTLYTSFVYGVLYLFFEAYPVVFVELHHMNPVLTGCTFLAFMLGCILGSLFYVFVENRIYLKRLKASPTNTVAPEFRLRPTMYAGPIITISLFWFAWTSYPDISPWSPIVAGGCYGVGILFIMLSLFTYIADTYQAMTASAMAANTMMRSGFGVGFPLFATQMYHHLDPRRATTVLACIAAVMVPIPFVLHKFGPYLRSKAQYAV